jgi:hypothetical protein
METRPVPSQELLQQHTEMLPLFDELLNTVIETCLTDRGAFERYYQQRLEELGQEAQGPIWRDRAVMELPRNGHEYPRAADGWQTYADMAKSQDSFLPTAIPEVQAKIEAFGTALLDEAFVSLGTDAPGWVERYRHGGEDDRVAAMAWLEGRVKAIHTPPAEDTADEINIDLSDETDEWQQHETKEIVDGQEVTTIYVSDLPAFRLVPIEHEEAQRLLASRVSEPVTIELDDLTSELSEARKHHYHPARLSPKLLGVYPETKFDPTCLGKSLLMASFLHKTGEPYLHAGVVRTAGEMARLTQALAAEEILYENLRGSVSVPDHVAGKLKSMIEANQQIIDDNNGFHAIVLARVADGFWAQYDPNYSMSTSIVSGAAKELDRIYAELSEKSATNPGVEVIFRENESYGQRIIADEIWDLLESLPSLEETERILDEIAAGDQPIENFKRYITETMLNGITRAYMSMAGIDESLLETYVDYQISGLGPKSIRLKIDFLEAELDEVIRKYLFSDLETDGEARCMGRVQQDAAYRQRRVEEDRKSVDDLRMAPVYLAVMIQSDVANQIIERKGHAKNMPHAVMEMGLPAYRIGACVLSDFGLYTGAELPFSFWASNWASYVTYGNHAPEMTDEIQTNAYRKMILATDTDSLAYVTSRGIIGKFLEQGVE